MTDESSCHTSNQRSKCRSTETELISEKGHM